MLIGSSFDSHLFSLQFQGRSDVVLHFHDMGKNFRFLGNNCRVEVDDSSTSFGDLPACFFEEHPACCSTPSGVGIGKEMANIALTQGAENRVTDSMHQHVGIGMSLETLGMRNINTAQNQLPALHQGMDIVTNSNFYHDG